jgi:hypothetical protein
VHALLGGGYLELTFVFAVIAMILNCSCFSSWYDNLAYSDISLGKGIMDVASEKSPNFHFVSKAL